MGDSRSAKQMMLCFVAFTLLLIGCSPQETLSTASVAPPIEKPASPTAPLVSPTPHSPATEQSANTLIWSAQMEALHTFGGHSEGVTGLVFLPDGIHLASLSGNLVLSLWDVKSGALVRTLTEPGDRVYNVAFSPDARLLAVGNHPANTVGLWDARDGQLVHTFKGNREFIMKVAFSPDGTLLASGDGGGIIKIWNVESKEEVGTFEAQGTIGSLAFSPDGGLLASGNVEGNTDIKLWDVRNGQNIHIMSGHSGNVYNLVFTPDSAQLASASGDRTIKFWDVESGQELSTLRGHRNFVYGLAMSPDGTLLASSDSDGMIKLWEVETGSELNTLDSHSEYVFFIAFSPDGSLLASGGLGDAVTLWGNPR